MHEDTPEQLPVDSTPSDAVFRNEETLPGVAMGMDPSETSDTSDQPLQASTPSELAAPTEPQTPSTDAIESRQEPVPSTTAMPPSATVPPTTAVPDQSTPEMSLPVTSTPETSVPPEATAAFGEPAVDFSHVVTVPFVYDEPTTAQAAYVNEKMPPPKTTKKDSKGSRTGLVLLGSAFAGILGAVLTVGLLSLTGAFDDPVVVEPVAAVVNGEQAVQPIVVAAPQIINGIGSSLNPTAVALKAVPSVVSINVFNAPANEGDPLQGVGSGSGVIISEEGYLVTNHHVIENADTYFVVFQDGREYEATLVGSDELTDLAVLRISADALVPVEFGSSDGLRVGDPTIAIGNPLGQEGGASVSVGIISAFDRTVEFGEGDNLQGMIQTDAAINSGSSGGGLFDAEGKLIGITSAIGVSQAGPEGIGYAIPVELVDRISSEIIETGDVEHPFLGVYIGTASATADDGATVPAGALIVRIDLTDSAAALAGLEVDDIVTEIGGKPITDQTDLSLAVRLYRVGDEVDFVVQRGDEELTVTVVMGQRPADLQG